GETAGGQGGAIVAGALHSPAPTPALGRARVLPPKPGVDEDGPAAATHHDLVQRPPERVWRQELVLHPGRPDRRVGVVAQHLGWQPYHPIAVHVYYPIADHHHVDLADLHRVARRNQLVGPLSAGVRGVVQAHVCLLLTALPTAVSAASAAGS